MKSRVKKMLFDNDADIDRGADALHLPTRPGDASSRLVN